jgi:nitrite reductase (NADH) large subunit
MRYVVIGNGVAGTTAASSIRDRDSSGDIMIVTDERLPFYSRIRLVEYLAGEADEAALIIRKEQWYREKGISLACSRTATQIMPGEGRITFSDGGTTEYDRLLVATGSVPFTPQIPGLHKAGVFTLRTVDDAHRITDYMRDRERALILGGGVLGIEVGNALRKTGRQVTIVEWLPRLLPRQLDAEGAGILQTTLERMGLSFCLDAKAQEIVGKERVEGLLLGDGRLLKGDMLLVSAGITPRTSLLQYCGLSVGRGVPVNDALETCLPGVYAAGDVIEHRGVRYGIWAAAERQGAVAGVNMAGGNAAYEGTLPSHTLKIAGVSLMSAGDIDAAGNLDTMIFKNPVNGIYRKVVFRNGRLAGCILCGDMSGRNELMKALSAQTERDALTDMLARLGLV